MEIPEAQQESSTFDFAVGETVFERYEILSWIASGGFGAVYKAKDKLLNIDVALKVLIVDSKNPTAVMRFQSEARTASKLAHPNIATIYDFGITNNKPYLVMEFVDGRSLQELLKKPKTLDLQVFKTIFVQLAEAIDHAHNNGIVHRDLKPENIIVSTESTGKLRAKVLDFGIAKNINVDSKTGGKLTATGNLVGSPLYMSPEQARGAYLSFQSDLYSLGAMMFRCLVGRPPIQGDTAIETIMLVANSSPPPIQQELKKQKLPQDLCDLIDDLLAKDPEQRPSLKDRVIPTLEKLEISPENDHTAAKEIPQTSSITSGTKSPPDRTRIIVGAITVLALGLAVWVIISRVPDAPVPNLKAKAKAKTESETTATNNEYNLVHDAADASNFDVDEQQDFSTIAESKPKGDDRKKVDLTDTDTTDKDLEKIPNPSLVKSMFLTKTKVSNLIPLKKFSNVESLSLAATNIEDDALINLSEMKLLYKLDLTGTPVSDGSLKHLKSLHKLGNLDLGSTHVTTAGVMDLVTSVKIKKLHVQEIEFSRGELEQLAKLLQPDSSIEFTPPKKMTEDEITELNDKYPDVGFNRPCNLSHQFKKLYGRTGELTPAANKELKIVSAELIRSLETAYGPGTPRARGFYLYLGNAEAYLKNAKRAAECYKTSALLSKQVNDTDLEASADSCLAIVLPGKQSDAALDRALQIMDAKSGTAEGTSFLIRLANGLKAPGTMPLSLAYYEKAFAREKKKRNPDRGTLALLNANKGDCFFWMNKPEDAKRAYQSGFQLFKKLNSLNNPEYLEYSGSYVALAELEIRAKNFKQALAFNDEALSLCHKFSTTTTSERVALILGQRLIIYKALKYPVSQIEKLTQQWEKVRKH